MKRYFPDVTDTFYGFAAPVSVGKKRYEKVK